MALHDAMQELMVLTMEECGELIQECSKSLRKDSYLQNENLKKELGDVYAMIELMHEFDIVSWEELEERVKVKRKKLKKWSRLIVND
jgi:NTP pyrophosphatase (non-canonical NTP hydrolase)